MNALTNRTAGGALAGLSSLKKNLQNVQTAIVATGGGAFLRLLKDGTWVYSAENIEVEKNSEWAVNPLSIQHGWVAWTDYKKKANEIVAEVMVSMGSPLPPYNELREVKDDDGNVLEYAQQIAFQLQCLTGEDKGEQVLYKATSVGGMNASKALLGSIINQLDTDQDNPVPVLVLTTDSYTHKTWGKTYVPVFEIVDWVPLDDAINAPIEEKQNPDDDQKTEQPAATQQRTRQVDDTVAISDEDRRSAIDAALADRAAERTRTRQAAAATETAAPRRRQRA